MQQDIQTLDNVITDEQVSEFLSQWKGAIMSDMIC